MTKEQKKDDTIESKADEELKDKSEEEEMDDSKSDSEDEQSDEEEESTDEIDNEEIDYQAITQREREATERAERAERALAEKEYKERERRRKANEGLEEEEDEDNKPLTRKELRETIEEVTQKTRKSLLSDRIHEIANNLASSKEEAEAIIATHANRTFPPTLSIQEQLEESYAIVNRRAIIAKNAELKRALNSKNNSTDYSPSGVRDGMKGVTPKVEKGLEESLKRQKFTYDVKSKIWKKKLPSGQFLCKDVRVKPIKTWVAKAS